MYLIRKAIENATVNCELWQPLLDTGHFPNKHEAHISVRE